jgi:hypothetical protein
MSVGGYHGNKNKGNKIYLKHVHILFIIVKKIRSCAMKKIFFIQWLFLSLLILPAAVSAVGIITVTSTPSGATVYLDGVSKGTTSVVIQNVMSGSHTLVLQKAGYNNYTTTVTVIDNQTRPVTAVLVISPITPTISAITPAYGFNTGVVSITDLSGTGFASGATVLLTKAGQSNISATGVSVTPNKITCNFNLNGKASGFWNVVVINPDGKSATKTEGFEIRTPSAAITLSGITPDYGINDDIVTITNLAGTGFLSGATMKLQKTGYNDIPGTVTSVVSSTKITGTFDLDGRTPGTYEVCVQNGATNSVCGLAFTVYSSDTPLNGTIYVESNPSAASAYIRSEYKGKTPLTIYNITPGTYTVLVQKSGYQDWSDRVTVTAGNRTYVYARLTVAGSDTTAVTTARTTVTTSTTTRKSTMTVPTPWPSATPSPAAGLDTGVILGAAATALVLIRKQ